MSILLLKLFSGPSFIIKIKNGRVSLVSGVAKKSFLADVQDIVNRNNLMQGVIYAVRNSYNAVTIKGSGKISADVLQNINNVFRFN